MPRPSGRSGPNVQQLAAKGSNPGSEGFLIGETKSLFTIRLLRHQILLIVIATDMRIFSAQ